jgi:hypothetical protein
MATLSGFSFMHISKKSILLFTLIVLTSFSSTAAEEAKLVGPTGLKSQKTHLYQRPTIAKLSQLYWALGKFQLDNDISVDNYLRINECDIYKDYHHNEFEWKNIRESGRKFLADNKKKFSLRFEYVQPLRFSEYDMQKKEFNVWDQYIVDGARSFEILAKDINDGSCGSGDRDIPGYPRGLNIELSRPFTLKSVPVPEELARKYILTKSDFFKSLKPEQQTQDAMYASRDAYVVMQVKIFAYNDDFKTRENYLLSKVLAVLESYEVYADRDLNQLIYSENTNKKKERSQKEVELKKKYQERLKLKMEADRAKETKQKTAAPTTPAAPAAPQ